VAAAAVVLLGTPATAGAGTGSGDGEIEVEVVLAGTDLAGDDTIELDPGQEAELQLAVTNGTGDELEVRKVRIAGSVLGMTFFTFTTQIDMLVDDDETGERSFTLDLSDLDGQASGLLAGRVELLGPGNDVLATERFTADARGSLRSTYSMFGLVVAGLTAILLLSVVQALRKSTLPTNRFNRGLRFAEPGAGLGLTMTFTLSALRIVLLPTAVGVLVIAIAAGAGFAIGYTLSRADEEEGEIDVRDQEPRWSTTATTSEVPR
jgi:hypothetical protein